MKIDLKQLFLMNEGSDERLFQTLLKAIASAHIKDFDYLKFRQSVRTMLSMDMDLQTSIKSAFATASTMGLTKDKLVKTAYHYQTALTKEKEKFAVALKNRIAKDIDGRRLEAQKLAKEIESHKQKMKKLQQEIDLYQKKIDSVESVVSGAMEKIELTRNSFQNTYEDLYSQIEEDIQNIEQLL